MAPSDPVPYPRRLRLHQGTNPEHALQILKERINAADNLNYVGSGSPDHIMRVRDEYIAWVEATEIQLANITNDYRAIAMLHTARYWAIREIVPYSARPVPLLDGERRWQRETLNRLRLDLEVRVAHACSAPGYITVIDSHTLLHYQLPDSISWRQVVDKAEVRLVIPLRVIEEIDEKKYGPSEKLRERARGVLPKLEAMLGVGGAPAPLSEGVTIEVPIEPPPRYRPQDADEEILYTAQELWRLGGQHEPVGLVTHDTSMRIRAQAAGGLRTISLPNEAARVRLAASADGSSTQ